MGIQKKILEIRMFGRPKKKEKQVKFRVIKDKETDTTFVACWEVPESRIEGLTKRVPRIMSYHDQIDVSHEEGSGEVFLYPKSEYDKKLLTDTLAMIGYHQVAYRAPYKNNNMPPSLIGYLSGDEAEYYGQEFYADPNH